VLLFDKYLGVEDPEPQVPNHVTGFTGALQAGLGKRLGSLEPALVQLLIASPLQLLKGRGPSAGRKSNEEKRD